MEESNTGDIATKSSKSTTIGEFMEESNVGDLSSKSSKSNTIGLGNISKSNEI